MQPQIMNNLTSFYANTIINASGIQILHHDYFILNYGFFVYYKYNTTKLMCMG